VLQARSALVSLREVAALLATLSPAAGADLLARVEQLESSALDFARLRVLHLASSGIARMRDGEAEELRLLATGERVPTRAAVMEAVERWRTHIEDPLLDGVTVEMCEHAIRLYEAAFTG
jgi:hypothetical protein